MARRPPAWIAYLLAGLAAIGVFFLLPEGGGAQGIVYLGVAFSAVVASFRAWWRNRAVRGGTGWLTLGLTVFFVGDVAWFLQQWILDRPVPFPSIADPLYLARFPLLIVGFWRLHRRPDDPKRGELIDAAILFVGLGTIAWTLIVARYHAAVLSTAAAALAAAYPLLALALLAVVLRVLFVRAPRSVSARLLSLALCLTAISDLLYSGMLEWGSYVSGQLPDAGWLCSYVLFGAAALVAAEEDPDEPDSDADVGITSRRLILLAGLCLSPLAVLGVSYLTGAHVPPAELVVASAVLLLLMLARVGSLTRTLDASKRELSASERRFRALIERSSDVISLASVDGTRIYTSPTVRRMLGYSPDELEGALGWKMIHPDEQPRVRELFHGLVETPSAVISATYRLRHRDGTWRWVEATAKNLLEDPAVHAVVVNTRDVTARVRAEAELRQSYRLLREAHAERERLHSQLVKAQEDERRRIAADIHDDPVQQMVGVGLRLASLRMQLSEPEHVAGVDAAASIVQTAVARMRHLLYELRPPELDRVGLAPAVATHLEQTLGGLGIEWHLETRLADEPSEDIRIVAYRVVQEGVANAIKHADAERIDVWVETTEEQLRIVVRDDGTGFQPTDEDALPGHLGLRAMRERTEIAGGTLSIRSTPMEGTTIEVMMPLPSSAPRIPRPALVRGS